jgi:hypothetical protein
MNRTNIEINGFKPANKKNSAQATKFDALMPKGTKFYSLDSISHKRAMAQVNKFRKLHGATHLIFSQKGEVDGKHGTAIEVRPRTFALVDTPAQLNS